MDTSGCAGTSGLDLRSSNFYKDGEVAFSHPALAESLVFSHRPESLAVGSGADGTSRKIWPAALSFAAYLCAHPDVVRGKTVCDLGTGSGIAGILCAALGAKHVWLTDVETALTLCAENLARNSTAAQNGTTCPCRWGVDDDVRRLRERAGVSEFSVIIACELVYKQSAETFDALVRTILELSGPSTVVLVVYEFRSELFDDLHFFELMLEHFEVTSTPLDGSSSSCEEYLYTYRRKENSKPRETTSTRS